jgi:hypothetical protein
MIFREFTPVVIVNRIRNSDAVFWTLIASWVLFFFGNVAGTRYTGWDTQDLGFTNFLYFSDALRNLSFPLWNPLIQSGTFHPNFFNAGNYTPFQWIFILLSYVVNPIYAYELMIQVVVLLGSVGFYLLLRSSGHNKYVALFGAQAFFLSTLQLIVGQVMFVFSLSALPWLLLICHGILQGKFQISWWAIFFWAAICASYMASGYPWMNVVNFGIAFLYSCNLGWHRRARWAITQRTEERERIYRCLAFLAAAALLLLCYYLPGYLSLKFYYQNFVGDYESPEPRLRALRNLVHYAYDGGIKDVLIGSIDPRILVSLPTWSWGAGLVVWMALFYRRIESAWVTQNLIWIVLAVFWVAYSAGQLVVLGEQLPLFNANRWWFIGQFYVSICLIFLAAANLQLGVEQEWRDSLGWLYLTIISSVTFLLLMHYSAPPLVWAFAVCGIIFFYFLAQASDETRWREAMILLITLNTAAFISMPVSLTKSNRSQIEIQRTDPAKNFSALVANRVKVVNITDNVRQIDMALEYKFNEFGWLLKKESYNHGYNPLGNPLYWHFKGEDFVRNLIFVTPTVRQEQLVQRRDFDSDNAYVNALIKDVRQDKKIPTVDHVIGEHVNGGENFQWGMQELKQQPNAANIRVWSNGSSYLQFNNTYFPGWSVSVNGKEADIVKMNRVFMGVYLDGAGVHEVEFRFRSMSTVALLFFPLLIIVVSLMAVFVTTRREFWRAFFFFVPHTLKQTTENK